LDSPVCTPAFLVALIRTIFAHEIWKRGVDVADKDHELNWNIDSVLRTLRREAQRDGNASAQVFLQDAVDSDELEATIQALLGEATKLGGDPATRPTVEKISVLSKSFALMAPPSIFAALADLPEVKSILPSALDDIYPKPKENL
jgi:hypothetical protein